VITLHDWQLRYIDERFTRMAGEGESITRLVNYEQHMIKGQQVQSLFKGLVICAPKQTVFNFAFLKSVFF
jgi:hypothetical protein